MSDIGGPHTPHGGPGSTPLHRRSNVATVPAVGVLRYMPPYTTPPYHHHPYPLTMV